MDEAKERYPTLLSAKRQFPDVGMNDDLLILTPSIIHRNRRIPPSHEEQQVNGITQPGPLAVGQADGLSRAPQGRRLR